MGGMTSDKADYLAVFQRCFQTPSRLVLPDSPTLDCAPAWQAGESDPRFYLTREHAHSAGVLVSGLADGNLRRLRQCSRSMERERLQTAGLGNAQPRRTENLDQVRNRVQGKCACPESRIRR